MSFTYTTIDGQRVETHVATAYGNLKAAFERAFPGLSLVISSATRTRAEQEAIFRARYTTSPGARHVYDTRIWNGVKWYRISAEGTVAVPGTSNHEDDGPVGPRAIDIRDTGGDKGVMTRGTVRDKWMEAHAGEHGFSNAGYNFGEPWHKEYTGSLADVAGGGGDWNDQQKQDFLNSIGYNTGAPGWGPMCAAATKDFQSKVGLEADGQFGPKTQAVAEAISAGKNQTARGVAQIQTALNAAGFDCGPADNVWGNHTSYGLYRFQRAKALTTDSLYGPASDAALFPTPIPPVIPPSDQTATARTPSFPGAARAWYLPWALARSAAVDTVFLHHFAGTQDDEDYFKTKNSRSSWPSFECKADGTIVEFAEPSSQQPSSTQGNNGHSISIETQNTSLAPNWGISDASFESIAQVIAWASKKFGFPIDRQHVRPHSDVYATACPGPTMVAHLDAIIARAQAIATPPVEPPHPDPDTLTVNKTDLLAVQAGLNKVISEGH